MNTGPTRTFDGVAPSNRIFAYPTASTGMRRESRSFAVRSQYSAALIRLGILPRASLLVHRG